MIFSPSRPKLIFASVHCQQIKVIFQNPRPAQKAEVATIKIGQSCLTWHKTETVTPFFLANNQSKQACVRPPNMNRPKPLISDKQCLNQSPSRTNKTLPSQRNVSKPFQRRNREDRPCRARPHGANPGQDHWQSQCLGSMSSLTLSRLPGPHSEFLSI